MNETLSRFLDALRHADLRVSPAEALDAYRAAEAAGFEDREFFRDSLAVAVAKSAADKATFDSVFDEFFRPPAQSALTGDAANEAEREPQDAQSQGTEGAANLAQMLLQGDDTDLLIAMQRAADQVGLENMWLFTQRNLYTRRILDAMGLEGLDASIQALMSDGSGGENGGPALADQLQEARGQLFDTAREYVEREYQIFARDTNRNLIEARLEGISMRNIDPRDRDRMKQLIRKLAKRLAALHSRRKKKPKRGQLDIRRTLRKNHINDDVLMTLLWKQKKIDRPRLMVVCDVSGSVAAVSQFLLFFVYCLNELVKDIRSFVLCSNLAECSEHFDRLEFDDAIEQALKSVILGSTDYGVALEDFCEQAMSGIDRRTTVLFLGDARSNETNPRIDLMERIHGQAKYVMWLNPEPRSFWGTGDSEMNRYLPYVDFAQRVSSVKELDRAIAVMLSRGIGLL